MINNKIIFQVIGLLLIIEGFFLGFSSLVSLYYGGSDFSALLITTGICVFTGIALRLATHNAEKNINKREGYIIVSLVWVVFSLFQ